MEISVVLIHNRDIQVSLHGQEVLHGPCADLLKNWNGLIQLMMQMLKSFGGKENILSVMLKAAKATCDFYIENTPADGVPYWDTGAPNLYKLGDYLNKPADPFNDYEPVIVLPQLLQHRDC